MSKTKKIIGIPGWKLGENSFGASTKHLDYIRSFGVPRIIFPEEELVNVDLLYLPGGPDLSPFTYGQFPGFFTSNPDVHKQFFFDARLQNYIDAKIPIFGVCLGFQMICAKFGSRLTQDLPDHPESKDRGYEAHQVFDCVSGRMFDVNSHHHQGIFIKDLGEDLSPLAVFNHSKKLMGNPAYRLNLVEAVRHRTLPIAGVQWHPEEFYTEFADILIEMLLNNKTA